MLKRDMKQEICLHLMFFQDTDLVGLSDENMFCKTQNNLFKSPRMMQNFICYYPGKLHLNSVSEGLL